MDEEVTPIENETPVWRMSRDGWQAKQGVHRPWICEISPMQYAHLSKRGKAEYDAKRAREWQASADCAQAYSDACFAAYQADLRVLNDPEIHPDAKSAIFYAVKRQEEQAQRARFDALQRENTIASTAEVEIGDRVYWLLGSRYVTITKKSKVSLRGTDERGEYKVAVRACQWLHYGELQEAAREGKTTVKPQR